MIKRNGYIKIDFIFLIVTLYSLVTMIYKSFFNGIIYLIIGLFVWTYIYIKTKKNHSSEFAIIRLIMLSIPMSFINILNGGYGSLPLSWFNIFFIILVFFFILKIIPKKGVKLNNLSLLSMGILILGILLIFISSNYIDALKQYLSMSITFICVIIGNNIKSTFSCDEKRLLHHDYIKGAILAAIGIVTQYVIINFMGTVVGTHYRLGGNRNTYAFLFTDFSFLSLYLVSGAMFIISFKNTSGKKNIVSYLYIIILLMTSALTSARTGILSFVLVISIYSFINFFRLLYKGSYKSFFVVILYAFLVIGSFYIFSILRPEDMLNDSGRFRLNNRALQVFKENPLLGVGFGVTEFKKNFATIPHNIIFQLLAQGGLIYTIHTIVFLLISFYNAYKSNITILYVLLTIILGSFFIPDIFNSRYIAAVYLLLSIGMNSSIIQAKDTKV